MRCAVLLYGAEELWSAATPAQRDSFATAHADFSDAVARAGHVIVSAALAPSSAATTVRLRDGAPSLTAGTEESGRSDVSGTVGGVYLVDVPDLDVLLDAVTLLPDYTVEIRPTIEQPARPTPAVA